MVHQRNKLSIKFDYQTEEGMTYSLTSKFQLSKGNSVRLCHASYIGQP